MGGEAVRVDRMVEGVTLASIERSLIEHIS